jgi:hypothetical protein
MKLLLGRGEITIAISGLFRGTALQLHIFPEEGEEQ